MQNLTFLDQGAGTCSNSVKDAVQYIHTHYTPYMYVRYAANWEWAKVVFAALSHQR